LVLKNEGAQKYYFPWLNFDLHSIFENYRPEKENEERK